MTERTKCEVWTRVMGYHRPVSHFNVGKKAEHYSRKHFLETIAANNDFCREYGIPTSTSECKEAKIA